MAQLSRDTFATGSGLMRIEEALDLVSARIVPVAEIEQVSIIEADGRVLARPLLAPIDLPVFDNSAVDGFAVAHADLSPTAFTTLPVSGRVAAGHGADHDARPGSAVRIFTGAPMPAGTDTVFMQEDTRLEADGRVTLLPGLGLGANRRVQGEDLARGQIALDAQRRLDPRDIALAAALGITHLEVRRKARVAVFSTGDEIVDPGRPLPPATLYDSNRFSIATMLRRRGCVVTDLGILRDRRDEIATRLREAANTHDLVVTSGGVSTGEEDHVRAAIEANGALVFWRLAIKPGRPLAMGIIDGTPLIGLPGNPVAVFITWAYVLRPLIARLAGEQVQPIPTMTVAAGFAHDKKPGRREFLRASITLRDGVRVAMKYDVDGAGVITSLTRTDGLVEIGEEVSRVAVGDPIAFVDYRLLF